MKKTTYLTGKPPEHYKCLLDPLADARIADMRELKRELRKELDTCLAMDDRAITIIRRANEIDKAIDWWQKLKTEHQEDI